MSLAGISEEELKSYMAPAEYKNDGEPVAQPAYNADVPHMDYPREAYEMLLQTPDEVIWETASETTAPSPNGYGS